MTLVDYATIVILLLFLLFEYVILKISGEFQK